MCLSAHLDTALCLYRLSYLGAAELTAETGSASAPSRGGQALRWGVGNSPLSPKVKKDLLFTLDLCLLDKLMNLPESLFPHL